ncbi:MAG: bifunctional nuclease domain-containing protein [Bacteroidota bacterium]
MEKVELVLVALTESISYSGQYALVFEDLEMKKRLSITIGSSEAQSIAMALEKVKPERPQTHDLYVNTLRRLEASLNEVIITVVEKNVFEAQLFILHKNETIKVDSRASDAVALSIRFESPIFIDRNILDDFAFDIKEGSLPRFGEPSLESLQLKELEQMLEKVIKNEDYEGATRIRNAINQKKNQ